MIAILISLTIFAKFAFPSGIHANQLGVIRGIFSSHPPVVNVINGKSACTATLVGPRVLLTAAHCGVNGDELTFRLNGQGYRATLARSPLHENINSHHDYAIAVIDRAVQGVEPWAIAGSVVRGDRLFFLGYGCSELNARTGAGPQRLGLISVSEVEPDWFEALRTVGSAVCPGDSGGPAFDLEHGRHEVRGVVSIYHYSGGGGFADITQGIARKYLADVASRLGVEICGITSACGREEPSYCRQKASLAGLEDTEGTKICGSAPSAAPLECYALARQLGWSPQQSTETCRSTTQPEAPIKCVREALSRGKSQTSAATLCRGAVVASGPVDCWSAGQALGWSEDFVDELCFQSASAAPVNCAQEVLKHGTERSEVIRKCSEVTAYKISQVK